MLLPRALMPVLLLFSMAAADHDLHKELARSSITSAPTEAATSAPAQDTSSVDLSSLLDSLKSAIPSSITSSSEPLISPTAQSTSPSSIAVLTTTSIPTSTSSSPSLASSSVIATTSTNDGNSVSSHERLVIILAVVISIVGFLLILIAFILFRRYKRGQSLFPGFSQRGASPIDDDEIATWRGHAQQMSETSIITYHHKMSSTDMISPPADTLWNLDSSPKSSKSEQILSPSIIAQAPNARSGLTDESKPGESPYIPPLKRQSSRLSKLPNHSRSKSLRSSLSASLPDRPSNVGTWAELDDDGTKRHFRGTSRGSRSVSMTKMSFDRSRPTESMPSTPQLPSPIHKFDIGRAIA